MFCSTLELLAGVNGRYASWTICDPFTEHINRIRRTYAIDLYDYNLNKLSAVVWSMHEGGKIGRQRDKKHGQMRRIGLCKRISSDATRRAASQQARNTVCSPPQWCDTGIQVWMFELM